jgi:hypothetical protein
MNTTTVLYRVAALLLALSACALFQNAATRSTANPKDWIQAFNGKNLTGGRRLPGILWVRTMAIRSASRTDFQSLYDQYPEFGNRFGHSSIAPAALYRRGGVPVRR